jgi:molecular chaperone IbpA
MHQQRCLFTILSNLHNQARGREHILESAISAAFKASPYPPADLLQTSEHTFELHFAMAGAKRENIEITQKGDLLRIEGKPDQVEKDRYIYQGIARRSFILHYRLGEHAVVESADLKDGLLIIKLKVNIPESAKPRSIAIG